jgi:hypothetical protein
LEKFTYQNFAFEYETHVPGDKSNKERLMNMCCLNAWRVQTKLTVTGNAKKPCSFKGIKPSNQPERGMDKLSILKYGSTKKL